MVLVVAVMKVETTVVALKDSRLKQPNEYIALATVIQKQLHSRQCAGSAFERRHRTMPSWSTPTTSSRGR